MINLFSWFEFVQNSYKYIHILGFLNSLKAEIDPGVEEVTLSSDDEKDSKSEIRKLIHEMESRDQTADKDNNLSRDKESNRSRSKDKSSNKHKRYSPEYSPEKSRKHKRSKR